jgi:hypothetical protein
LPTGTATATRAINRYKAKKPIGYFAFLRRNPSRFYPEFGVWRKRQKRPLLSQIKQKGWGYGKALKNLMEGLYRSNQGVFFMGLRQNFLRERLCAFFCAENYQFLKIKMVVVFSYYHYHFLLILFTYTFN